MRDIKLATGALSVSELMRSSFEIRAMQVINPYPSV
jgi:hypothetical protein